MSDTQHLPSANGASVMEGHQSSMMSAEHTSNISPDQIASKRSIDEVDGTVDNRDKRRKGTAPVKEEYIIRRNQDETIEPKPEHEAADDDAAEAFHHKDRNPSSNNAKNTNKKREKQQGQNKARKFGSSRDEVGLCATRAHYPEFSPKECPFGEGCRFDHNIRNYLKSHKREDLTTFGGLCPVWDVKGKCTVGWKCRFVGSHSKEVVLPDGRSELQLTEDAVRVQRHHSAKESDEGEAGVANVIENKDRILLAKRKFPTPKADVYLKYLDKIAENPEDQGKKGKQDRFKKKPQNEGLRNSSSPEPSAEVGAEPGTDRVDNQAAYVEPPLLPSEKRRLYFGAETPVLAPLTTQGNLPFRRLCTSLGATFTYSEMAMSMPILQGQKSELALIKAHESEMLPPTFSSKANIVYDYDQSKDMRFGAQIAANKPWVALRATEALTTLLPGGLRCIDLNCGCPIDLVYREGAGSAMMDSPNKLDKMLRGMNAVSGETPITCKIRTGTRDKQPTAHKLVQRLVLGAEHSRGDPCGVAAITLHGRSRQQRYSRNADWEYIADTAALIKNFNERAAVLADTIYEPDERDQPNGHKASRNGKVFFLGNGDVYSHVHYNNHIEQAGVDSVMVARGALIKPWVFEEIEKGQYLDKSSSERLRYIEQFCRNGLEAWGSDEIGVGQTRRFLLEWLSFACRYVPVGLLEYLPPEINDRPPAYKGRNDLETLMASDNFKDWIKIRYVC